MEIVLQVKLREDDDLVTTEDGGHAHNDKPINMAVWKQAEGDVSVTLAECVVAERFVVFRYLDRVGNHVAVGDHDAFLQEELVNMDRLPRKPSTYRQTRCTTGVAKECRLPRPLTLGPFYGFQLW